MKNVIKALSGKKALFAAIVLVIVGSVLEITTSIRTGVTPDYQGMAVYWIALGAWSSAIGCGQDKKIKAKIQ